MKKTVVADKFDAIDMKNPKFSNEKVSSEQQSAKITKFCCFRIFTHGNFIEGLLSGKFHIPEMESQFFRIFHGVPNFLKIQLQTFGLQIGVFA